MLVHVIGNWSATRCSYFPGEVSQLGNSATRQLGNSTTRHIHCCWSQRERADRLPLPGARRSALVYSTIIGREASKESDMSRLEEYEKKRRFDRTAEPAPEVQSSKTGYRFVVQKHRASQLHYDFRLESEGVLKSWAVPKGPSPNPSVKRLAMSVEDHPMAYADFEGVITEGEYGGGTVMVWDRGTFKPENGDVEDALKKGELKFTLRGKKLKGSWVLVRTKGRTWLLIKHRDRYASDVDLASSAPTSVISRRTLAEIAEDEGGNVEKAASGDPPLIPTRTRVVRRKRRRRAVWQTEGSE